MRYSYGLSLAYHHSSGTTFPSPIGLSASFNTALISKVAGVIATEAEGLGISQIFAPVLDLSRGAL